MGGGGGHERGMRGLCRVTATDGFITRILNSGDNSLLKGNKPCQVVFLSVVLVFC